MTDSTNPQATPEAAEQRIREELEKAASLISGARRLMSEGRNVDLSALEERTRAINGAVQAAPKAVAQGFVDHLDALMEALDALQGDIETQHQAVEQGLDAIRRREAKGAYQSAPSPEPSPPDDGDD